MKPHVQLKRERSTGFGDPRRHPQDQDLYTPMTVQLVTLLFQMRKEHSTWREVSARSGLRLKILRNLYQGNRKAVSMRTMDKLITATSVGNLDDFEWFTAQDLVSLTIWKPVEYFAGLLPEQATKRSSDGVAKIDT